MAEIREIQPSFEGGNLIRTYPDNYESESENESEREVLVEEEEGELDLEQHSIPIRLGENKNFMDLEITGWTLKAKDWKTADGTNVQLIQRPTASKLSHRLLNPYIYRNVQEIGTLNDLAVLLGTADDWEARYIQVVANGLIIRKLDRFRALADNAAESDIQSRFIGLVEAIAFALQMELDTSSETKIIVGGILARLQYDLRSQTDPHFLNSSGMNLIASEVKTHLTFAPSEMWYHRSRGIQVLSALYAFNCPTFLLTHRQWKLFVENSERNAIFTYPYNDNNTHTPHVNSSLVQNMGRAFLKAIVICLLSQRVTQEGSMELAKNEESIQVHVTPKNSIIKSQYFNTSNKPPPRRSARLNPTLTLAPESGKKIPSFVSGYTEQGQPIYTMVRVVPQEVVAEIEAAIEGQEMNDQRKMSFGSAIAIDHDQMKENDRPSSLTFGKSL